MGMTFQLTVSLHQGHSLSNVLFNNALWMVMDCSILSILLPFGFYALSQGIAASTMPRHSSETQFQSERCHQRSWRHDAALPIPKLPRTQRNLPILPWI